MALQDTGIQFERLFGKLQQHERVRNLKRFADDPSCRVLLATIRCGGVGIDLRCAQNVYIMVCVEPKNKQGFEMLNVTFFPAGQEPSWNPAVEDQAVDRLYRLGQKEEVHVFYYFAIGTVESNIQQVKRKKEQLAM